MNINKKPSSIEKGFKQCIVKNSYPFNASAPPTISNISPVIAA